MRPKSPFSVLQVATEYVRNNPGKKNKEIYLYFATLGMKRTAMSSYLSQIRKSLREEGLEGFERQRKVKGESDDH